jgi:curved DNA-binding protein CbpA
LKAQIKHLETKSQDAFNISPEEFGELKIHLQYEGQDEKYLHFLYKLFEKKVAVLENLQEVLNKIKSFNSHKDRMQYLDALKQTRQQFNGGFAIVDDCLGQGTGDCQKK